MPGPTHFTDALNLIDIADGIAMVSASVLTLRVENTRKLSPEQTIALAALEDKLDSQVVQFRSLGVLALGANCDEAQASIVTATKAASEFIKKMKRAERAIIVAAAVLTLGQAIAVKDLKAILTSAKEVSALCQFE